ncbi:MAG: glycosyltransferase family 2 protein [Polyangia bacterium]
MKICAVIPVFDNADTIGEVVRRTRAVMEPDVLVVSDGSGDGSDDAARAAGAEVVSHERNLGKGRAILTGLEACLERGFTHAVMLDADGQHLPEEIPALLDAAWDNPDKLIVGERRMDPALTPASSRHGRAISNFWATVDGWRRFRDVQSGFRVYPIEATLALGCREPRFSFEMEVLVRASWAGLGFVHVPVSVCYPNRRSTHFDMRGDNLRFSWLSFCLFWGMLARLPLLLWRVLANI